MAIDVIFRLLRCSPEDPSFKMICLGVLEGIKPLNLLTRKKFELLMWFKKYRLETSFKGDNAKALIKTSSSENLNLYFSKNVQQIAAFAVLFWFSLTKQSLKNGFGFPT